MTFLAPAYLWLGLLLIIPLILYLLPLPRRRLATAALYLWERFLEKEPFGKASERTRRALGFALLAAIFICLILAAAEFSVGQAGTRASKVIVVMDVSASMNATNPEAKIVESRLKLAKRAAGELVASLGGSSQVTIMESGEPMQTIAPLGPPSDATSRSLMNLQP